MSINKSSLSNGNFPGKLELASSSLDFFPYLLWKKIIEDKLHRFRPNALPVTQPIVSKHLRKLTAMTPNQWPEIVSSTTTTPNGRGVAPFALAF